MIRISRYDARILNSNTIYGESSYDPFFLLIRNNTTVKTAVTIPAPISNRELSFLTLPARKILVGPSLPPMMLNVLPFIFVLIPAASKTMLNSPNIPIIHFFINTYLLGYVKV